MRRNRERKQAVHRELEQYALALGVLVIEAKRITTRTLPEAKQLVREASELYTLLPGQIIVSGSDAGLWLLTTNIPQGLID